MKLRALHQFAPTIASGDAVGNDCLELQHLIATQGVRSDLFAEEAKPEVSAFVREWRRLAYERRKNTALLVHVSMGNDTLDEVAALALPKAVVYHNITPARYFEGISEQNRHYAERGREQLRALAKTAALGIGDSEFNRAELVELGFKETAVVPILLDEGAYEVEPDPAVLRELGDERTDVVCVGQILPQKAVHDVIAAFARYRQEDPTARLHLVGSHAMSGPYADRLRRQIAELSLDHAVRLVGKVSQGALVAYYRGASALLTLSEHEGFCVPLLEAMRFGLPIVAHAAGAIPETLGDAGILLRDKSPDRVAEALQRAVRDESLREDLVARGHARLAEFAPARVGERLREALSLAGWEIPMPRARTIAVLSSDRVCGVHDYGVSLAGGLRRGGHRATFVGVRHLDSADLARRVAAIPASVDAVIVEHEAGIFRDVSFVFALLRLWRRGIKVVLSLHELEPEKFHHYRRLTAALHYRPRFNALVEAIRLPWVALRIFNWFVRYRVVLAVMGAVPRRIIVHSDRSNHFADLLTRDVSKIDLLPLGLMPLEGVTAPRGADERRALRDRLGLPADRFVFVSPGFFFRRKQFLEVIAATPPEAMLVLAGTRSDREGDYYDEVMRYLDEHRPPNVRVDTEFARMPEHVVAADCVVLYYEDIFQSAIATQAIWAGLPLIISDIRGLRLYAGASLVARDTGELREAMRAIQEPRTYESLRGHVGVLRRLLAPERLAARYLAGVFDQ